MGSSLVLFYVSSEITLRQFRSGESRYTQKSFAVGKRYLTMVKRASVTTANATLVDGALSKKSQWCYKV